MMLIPLWIDRRAYILEDILESSRITTALEIGRG